MRLQRRNIVLPLVAERSPEGFDAVGIAHQHVPEIVTDLMAKVAEQRAIGFAHRGADALAFRVVGFPDRERDEPVVVAGHHILAVGLRRLAQEVEGQAMRRIVGPVGQRQVQAQKRVEQPMLGGLDPCP